MAEEKEVEKVDKNKAKEYALVEVPTAYGIAIQTPEGNVLSNEQASVLILNKLDEIKKVLG